MFIELSTNETAEDEQWKSKNRPVDKNLVTLLTLRNNMKSLNIALKLYLFWPDCLLIQVKIRKHHIMYSIKLAYIQLFHE